MGSLLLLVGFAHSGGWSPCQEQATIVLPEGIVAEEVPEILITLAEQAGPSSEYRSAFVTDWHP